jgi:hypothetical protein
MSDARPANSVVMETPDSDVIGDLTFSYFETANPDGLLPNVIFQIASDQSPGFERYWKWNQEMHFFPGALKQFEMYYTYGFGDAANNGRYGFGQLVGGTTAGGVEYVNCFAACSQHLYQHAFGDYVGQPFLEIRTDETRQGHRAPATGGGTHLTLNGVRLTYDSLFNLPTINYEATSTLPAAAATTNNVYVNMHVNAGRLDLPGAYVERRTSQSAILHGWHFAEPVFIGGPILPTDSKLALGFRFFRNSVTDTVSLKFGEYTTHHGALGATFTNSALIGNGTDLQFTIEHTLGSLLVDVQAYDVVDPANDLKPWIVSRTLTQVVVEFPAPPTTDQYRIVIARPG